MISEQIVPLCTGAVTVSVDELCHVITVTTRT